jgi:hypothetical protein
VTETIQLITQFGAIAVLVIGMFMILRGDIRTRHEIGQVEKAASEAIGRLDNRIKALMEEHARELVQVRAEHQEALRTLMQDRDFFREGMIEALQKADRSAEVAQRALEHAESTGR